MGVINKSMKWENKYFFSRIMEPTFTFSYGTSNAQMTVFFYFEPASQAYVTVNIEIVCKMQKKTKQKQKLIGYS